MKRHGLCIVALAFTAPAAVARSVPPVLEFPQQGMDDPAAYGEYRTRFYRDSAGTTLQIYLREDTGRVVHVLADSLNESVSFTVREASGGPVAIDWDRADAEVQERNGRRSIRYALSISAPSIEIGHVLLGSMRKEREFQDSKKDLLSFESPPFDEPELVSLMENLQRLPRQERKRSLEILRARDTEELRARIRPAVSVDGRISVRQAYFDGGSRLWLELEAGKSGRAVKKKNSVLIRSPDGRSPVGLIVTVSTDAPPLALLDRGGVFSGEFLEFYRSTRSDPALFRWLDREVRGLELVSSRTKLMAGLPNYATYFGRDTIVAALMLEPIWAPSMLGHAITSALAKLSPRGEVSHEEALGGQAIRENAADFNRLAARLFQEADRTKAAGILDEAASVLRNLRRVRENYAMVDDDFQLPVLVARYLHHPLLNAKAKRTFLGQSIGGTSRMALILRNLSHVSRTTAAYAQEPTALNLVSFPEGKDRWTPASWRDSNAGYGGGRFAMDVNAIWVPNALQSIASILDAARTLGFSNEDLLRLAREGRPRESRAPRGPRGRRAGEAGNDAALAAYVLDRDRLRRAIETWEAAIGHFKVSLRPAEVEDKLRAKLGWFPAAERQYWQRFVPESRTRPLEFVALSLDERGEPIRIMNTDPATMLFLDGRLPPEGLDAFLLHYPEGLFVDGLGPVVANDAYAPREVWERFKEDDYHSPRVVWGREVNLLILGLMKKIQSSGTEKLDPVWREALEKTLVAVERSGLRHSELWSYRIDGGKLLPERYRTSDDIQLWNLTDLVVQFMLGKSDLHRLRAARAWAPSAGFEQHGPLPVGGCAPGSTR